MSAPRVSVVIPTYNRGELLVEAVRSALAQTFDDLEVIVADDGSEDGSTELVRELGDRRLEVLRLEHTGVPAVARNAALRRASGELVAFLDSDDVWVTEKLERQVAVLDCEPAVGLVCSNASVIDENGNETRRLYLRPEQGASGDVLEELLDVNFVVLSSAIARRRLVEQARGFPEDPQLRAVEDYGLWLRLGAVSRVVYFAEPLLAYREHAGSVRLGVPRTAHWTSLLAALDDLDRFLDESDPRRRTLLRGRRAELFVELARAQRSELGRAAAMRSLREAVRHDPATAAAHVLSSSVRTLRSAGTAVRSAVRRTLVLG